MNYIQLGGSELKVSQIGLGCMSLGTDEKQATGIIDACLDQGIIFFDTADIYANGHNEALAGKALHANRSKVIIATKVGNVTRPDGSGRDWNPRKEHILSSVEDSLKRLQTDYIDLYQLHGGTIEDPIDETIEAFELLKSQGKIRSYGISSIRPNVIREYIKRASLTSVMMQYSLLDTRPEEECLDLLHQNNIGVLARGTIAQGMLSGKPARPYLERSKEDVQKAAAAVAAASGPARSDAQTAIRYVLSHPAVTSAIVGIRTMEQLGEVVGAASAPQLTPEEIADLRARVGQNVYRDHR